jgi:DNA-binding LacI/PurR family transcriptional regulator
LAFVEENPRISLTRLPVLWEAPGVLREIGRQNRSALLLNDRPRPGLEAAFIDSVSIDDFSGGASAAQLLVGGAKRGKFAILSGPEEDARNRERRDGFLSIFPDAGVVSAGSWFFEAGLAAAPAALKKGPQGVFCCNDRLAAALRHFCEQNALKTPPIVGFDDAPIAETLDLTTIALPWDDLITGALEIIKKRLSGASGAARQLILTPLPTIRSR